MINASITRLRTIRHHSMPYTPRPIITSTSRVNTYLTGLSQQLRMLSRVNTSRQLRDSELP